MKALKGLDFKALFIDHVEKMVAGMIVLFVLCVLGLNTQWSRFAQTPEELKAKINKTTEAVDSPANKWPQAKMDQFVLVDFTDKARRIFTGLNVEKYEFSTHLYWPLYRKKEKAKEPEYLPAQYVIAHAGEAILAISTAPAQGAGGYGSEMALATDGAPKPGDDSMEEYKDPNKGARPGAPGAAQGLNMQPPVPAAIGAGRGRTPAGAHGMSGEMSSSGMGGAPVSGNPSGISARGARYIAVRAIVPLKEQIDKAMRALNLSSYADASAQIEYTDFVLQRQTAIAGSDPWAGKWEDVNIKAALELLAESADFDSDPVPADLQDAVFTMGLPLQLLKNWRDHATHPNIKNFQLSKEEQEREEKLQAKLLEEFERLKLQSTPKIQKKGLMPVQNDLRGAAISLARSEEGSASMRQMQQMMSEAGGRGMAVPDIKAKLTASGRVYLFRYFDFDVQPGLAYRYRLKLELKNPNFERPYDEVENPDFTREPYRQTGWSNISNVAVVPESIHYYLEKVERDPMLDDKPSKKAVASIAMFEWDPKIGTMLADTLKILSVGQFIADPNKKTWVLDPAVPSFEEKKVPRPTGEQQAFVTEDVLLDARGDLDLSPELHPDLGLKVEKGRKEAKVGMLDEALVVNAAGQLKELDPLSDLSEEQSLRDKVAAERRNYLYLKDLPKENEGAGNNAYQRMMASNNPAEGPMSSKAANPRKRGGPLMAGGSSSAPGPGMPAPPGRRRGR